MNMRSGINNIAVRSVVTALTLAAVILLSACATTSTASPGELVRERAQARWDALLNGDFATAYSYLSPGYRSATTVVDYEIEIRMRKVQYRTAEFQDYSCEESICTVRLKIGYKIAKPVPGMANWESDDVVSEQWIKSDGNWWFLPQS